MFGSTELALSTAEVHVDISSPLVPPHLQGTGSHVPSPSTRAAPALERGPTRGETHSASDLQPGDPGPSLQCHSPGIRVSWRSALLNCHAVTCTQNN